MGQPLTGGAKLKLALFEKSVLPQLIKLGEVTHPTEYQYNLYVSSYYRGYLVYSIYPTSGKIVTETETILVTGLAGFVPALIKDIKRV